MSGQGVGVFTGFSEDALEFFDALSRENTRAYWDANKARYERSVRAPFLSLLAELEPGFGPAKVHRPYRDIRFSKDKSLYKTEISAGIGGGESQHGYVRLDAAGLGAASGIYGFSSDQLGRYRSAVANDESGDALEAIVEALRGNGLEVHPDGLKTAPRGYAKDHPRVDLLRRTGLVGWRSRAAGPWLETDEAVEWAWQTLAWCVPLNEWLTQHVGPPRVEPTRRR